MAAILFLQYCLLFSSRAHPSPVFHYLVSGELVLIQLGTFERDCQLLLRPFGKCSQVAKFTSA